MYTSDPTESGKDPILNKRIVGTLQDNVMTTNLAESGEDPFMDEWKEVFLGSDKDHLVSSGVIFPDDVKLSGKATLEETVIPED